MYVCTFQASDDHIQQLSQLLKLSVKDYMNESKSALSTHGGSTDYTYVVEDGQFVWKKLDQCSKVRMKYGYIQLEKVRRNVCLMAVDVRWDLGDMNVWLRKCNLRIFLEQETCL
jgi:hypothetical protein